MQESKAVKMSVYEALERRKRYIKRLNDGMATMKGKYPNVVSMFCEGAAKDGEKDKLEKLLQGNYDMIISLQNNIAAIDEAISVYNANQIITIAGKEYSIAAAIAKEKRIDAEIEFFTKCLVYADATEQEVKQKNDTNLNPDKVNDYVGTALKDRQLAKGEDVSKTVESLTIQYKKLVMLEFIDPNKIRENAKPKLEAAELFRDRFHTEIIQKNYSTEISVDLSGTDD